MKIKQEHFEHLKSEIESVLEKYPGLVQEYETGNGILRELSEHKNYY